MQRITRGNAPRIDISVTDATGAPADPAQLLAQFVGADDTILQPVVERLGVGSYRYFLDTAALPLTTRQVVRRRAYSPSGDPVPVAVEGAFEVVTAFPAVEDPPMSGLTHVDVQTAIQNAQGWGGIAQLQPAAYTCTAPITLPDGVILQGRGICTVLNFPSDLGAGVNAIIPQTHSSGQIFAGQIRDLKVQGPGAYTVGTRTCQMNGIQLGASASLRNVQVFGFGAGVVLSADHNELDHCKISQNYYNVWFADHPVTKGNHQFYNCVLDGSQFASVCVGGDNIMDGCVFLGGHLGFGPYGFYKKDCDDGTPSTNGLMSESTVIGLAFEACGNGAILDESTGTGSGADTFYGSDIWNPGFSWGAANLRIAARPRDWSVKVRNVTTTKIRSGTFPFLTGDVGAIFAASAGGLDIDGALTVNQFGSGSTWSAALATLHDGTGWRGRAFSTSAAVTAGDLLKFSTSFTVAPYTTGAAFAGVALQTVPSGGVVPVALPGGSVISVTCEAVGTAGVPITAASDTPRCGAAGTLSSLPLVGVSWGPGGSPSGSAVTVQLY